MYRKLIRSNTIFLVIIEEIVTQVRIVSVKNKDTILARTRRGAKMIEMLNIAKGQVTVRKASSRAYE